MYSHVYLCIYMYMHVPLWYTTHYIHSVDYCDSVDKSYASVSMYIHVHVCVRCIYTCIILRQVQHQM